MTSTNLTISGTIGSSGTITQNGGVPADILDDASDSTYLQFSYNSAGVFSLSTFSLPSGARLKTWQTNVRARNFSGTNGEQLASYVGTGAFDLVGGLAISPGSSVANMTFAPQVAPNYTQAQIDDMRLALAWLGAVGNAQVYEASLTVTYATIPTATITYPVSAPELSATSTLDATWTHTPGSDGGPQQFYEWKVFTAAQYGAGGFSADTSTPTLTSGVVTSSSWNASVGPLPNSTTFRFYLRTAQVVNGAAHWSAWDFEGFTTDFTPAVVDAVTPIATNGTGSITVTVDRDTGTWASIELERTDDGGTTWVPVRGGTNVTETNTFCTSWGANSIVVVDYEAPNGIAVTYRSRATTALGVVGAWVSSSTTSWTSTTVWLKDPHDPTLNLTLAVREMPQPTRVIAQGIAEIIGAEYVAVVSDVRRGASGTFVAQTATKDDGATLDSATASPFKLLQFPATHLWGSKYIAVGDIQEIHLETHTDLLYRRWLVAYVQTARPADHTDY